MLYTELSKLPLFKNLSVNSVDCLNNLAYVVTNYQVGESVTHFGEPIDYINVVMSGTLKTNEYTFEGKEIVSSYYSAYDAFPFYLLYSKVYNYPYNVVCHKKAKVILLPVKGLID